MTTKQIIGLVCLAPLIWLSIWLAKESEEFRIGLCIVVIAISAIIGVFLLTSAI